jgi:hypothetical protein
MNLEESLISRILLTLTVPSSNSLYCVSFYSHSRHLCSFKLVSLYRRGTDLQKKRVTCQNAWRGPHRKQPLLLKRLCSHVIATQPVHWRAGCCLAMVPYRHSLKREGIYISVALLYTLQYIKWFISNLTTLLQLQSVCSIHWIETVINGEYISIWKEEGDVSFKAGLPSSMFACSDRWPPKSLLRYLVSGLWTKRKLSNAEQER